MIVRIEIAMHIGSCRGAREHPPESVAAIAKSLSAFGQQKPVVIDRDGRVLSGGGVMQAADSLGWKEIDAVYSNLSGLEADAFAIADNRTAELAEWDYRALDAVAREVSPDLLLGIGWDEAALEQVAKSAGESAGAERTETERVEFVKDMDKKHEMVACPTCGFEFDVPPETRHADDDI